MQGSRAEQVEPLDFWTHLLRLWSCLYLVCSAQDSPGVPGVETWDTSLLRVHIRGVCRRFPGPG